MQDEPITRNNCLGSPSYQQHVRICVNASVRCIRCFPFTRCCLSLYLSLSRCQIYPRLIVCASSFSTLLVIHHQFLDLSRQTSCQTQSPWKAMSKKSTRFSFALASCHMVLPIKNKVGFPTWPIR